MPEHSDLKTPLFDLHHQLGARMVSFAGYTMPVQYPLGVLKEHLHTRQHAGLFDVSHMGQLRIKGHGIAEALESLIPVDLAALPDFKQVYGLLTHASGGILDDLIITRWATDEFFLVVNAACKQNDIAHLQQHLPGFEIEVLEQQALLALQGPKARAIIDQLAPAATSLRFMSGCFENISIAGDKVPCFITCSGYTGEDGFEISLPARYASALAQQLLAFDEVEAIGLGARDSLRLEAGLCLYGHDMDTSTTPLEAGLWWSVSKSRRPGGSKAGAFLGAEAIFEQLQQGAPRMRVGLKVDSRAPVREGTALLNQADEVIGHVTSGGFAPSLGSPVAMGYVQRDYSLVGTSLGAPLRGKRIPLEVVPLPFVRQNYVR